MTFSFLYRYLSSSVGPNQQKVWCYSTGFLHSKSFVSVILFLETCFISPRPFFPALACLFLLFPLVLLLGFKFISSFWPVLSFSQLVSPQSSLLSPVLPYLGLSLFLALLLVLSPPPFSRRASESFELRLTCSIPQHDPGEQGQQQKKREKKAISAFSLAIPRGSTSGSKWLGRAEYTSKLFLGLLPYWTWWRKGQI